MRCDALDRVHIGLDYFDATINRIGAYVIGSRATQKAFMLALLEPIALLRQYEDEESISSVLPCRRKRRVCLGVRFGICIVCKVGSP